MGRSCRLPAVPQSGRPLAAPANRIDSSQMPRPLEPALRECVEYVSSVDEDAPPPVASSSYRVVDGGNCSPRFARLSLHRLPTTLDVLKASKLPLAVALQPMADREDGASDSGEAAVEVVDHLARDGEAGGPPRCQTCRGFVNPFVEWNRDGEGWTCNLCGAKNILPQWYKCGLDASGRRNDASERPELRRASVDFVVGKDYCVRPVQDPVVVLVFDVGDAAWLQAAVDAARRCVDDDADADGARERAAGEAQASSRRRPAAMKKTRFGVVTYGEALHFYRRAGDGVSVGEVADPLGDAFGPFAPSEWLLDDAAAVHAMLDAVLAAGASDGAAAPQRPGRDLCVSALRAAGDALSQLGGKVVLFAVGRARALRGDGADGDLAAFFAKGQISLDVHVAQDRFQAATPADDVSAHVAVSTGGAVHCYDPGAWDAHALRRNVRRSCTSVAAECVLKVRCSKALRCVGLLGGGGAAAVGAARDEVELAHVGSASTFLFELEQRGAPLADGAAAYVQAALLHSDSASGRRIVRVHTLCVKAVAKASTVYRFADLDVIVAAMVRQAGSPNRNNDEVREQLVDRLVAILQHYRHTCADKSPLAQLILPDSIKLLPLYALGALKGPLLRAGRAQVDADDEDAVRHVSLREAAYATMPAREFSRVAYPRLYSAVLTAGDALPQLVPSSAESLRDSAAVFVLDTRDAVIVYIGADVPRRDDVYRALVADGSGADAAHGRLASFVSGLSFRRSVSPPLRVVMNDADYALLLERLVEDQSKLGMSYVDFLCSVHRHIQQRAYGG
ncbi:hypothetical protein M885DRAFT_537706 [Pelagophyceae sp. CCMP2097]|nr:hypothetical protein M885DRAFT_537706 [Pelagophyceae sp. CCMP2097]|mmetsp:Transcript_22515/g.78097  ORF Transcript_22515/g.78097 Transcript_22515/m.78097 type:complete len:792 (+) Transcript_22515:158-2533(+)